MIKIIDPTQYKVKLKASIHKSGRLGFTSGTADVLNFIEFPFVLFAQDDETENTLYMALLSHETDRTFKVNKSGKYFYIQTNLMFDQLGFDYRKKSIMFDLIRDTKLDEDLSGKTYRLSVRYGKTKK